MVGFSESQQVAAINKVFADSYKSPLSVIVLDNIERLLGKVFEILHGWLLTFYARIHTDWTSIFERCIASLASFDSADATEGKSIV